MLTLLLAALHAQPSDDVRAPIVLGNEGSYVSPDREWVRPVVEPGKGFNADLTFRPWSPFYILKRGEWGTWSLLGTSFGGCLDQISRMPCEDRAEAGVALAWTPRNSMVSFFGGLGLGGYGKQVEMSRATGVSVMGGILLTPPALVDFVKRRSR